VRPGCLLRANHLAMLGGAGDPSLAGLQGGSLTYRHEDGMNYARIVDGLLVGSCLQTPADLDKCARRARPDRKAKNHLCAVSGTSVLRSESLLSSAHAVHLDSVLQPALESQTTSKQRARAWWTTSWMAQLLVLLALHADHARRPCLYSAVKCCETRLQAGGRGGRALHRVPAGGQRHGLVRPGRGPHPGDPMSACHSCAPRSYHTCDAWQRSPACLDHSLRPGG
jgi:hypothetical protein